MEEPDYKTIGINIKIKRIRQGISQAKLAKLLGVSAAHLCPSNCSGSKEGWL